MISLLSFIKKKNEQKSIFPYTIVKVVYKINMYVDKKTHKRSVRSNNNYKECFVSLY